MNLRIRTCDTLTRSLRIPNSLKIPGPKIADLEDLMYFLLLL